MCIVALAWQCFPTRSPHSKDLPMVLLSNRDEVYARPTLALHHWQDMPILAGRDTQSGGTWLGINPKTGQWATVLNVRQVGQPVPSAEQRISRGKLVTDFLVSSLSPRAYLKQIMLNHFEGFNLIVGNREQAFIVSNRGQAITSLPVGLHVFSNGAMSGMESQWFKSNQLRASVRQEVLPLIASAQHETLAGKHSAEITDNSERDLAPWQKASFTCLANNTKAKPNELPNTGLPESFEQALSSVFIEKLNFQGGYGTRVSSLVTLSDTGYDFVEKQHYPNDDMSTVQTDKMFTRFRSYE